MIKVTYCTLVTPHTLHTPQQLAQRPQGDPIHSCHLHSKKTHGGAQRGAHHLPSVAAEQHNTGASAPNTIHSQTALLCSQHTAKNKLLHVCTATITTHFHVSCTPLLLLLLLTASSIINSMPVQAHVLLQRCNSDSHTPCRLLPSTCTVAASMPATGNI